jgi:hypothetical protein
MDKLPKHIADMVGIIDGDEPSGPVITRRDEPMMSVSFDPDGTITIAYDGKVCGWINEISYPEEGGLKYRALAANGHGGHFWSVDAARSFLMSEAF